MKYVTSSRRQVVMALLLSLAVIGGVIRYVAPPSSVSHDMGTLLLVLWVPAIGNVVAFVVQRAQVARHQSGPAAFGEGTQFTAQVVVALEPYDDALQRAQAMAPGERLCTVIVGSDGFTARAPRSLLLELGDGGEVPLEFMRPALALPKLAPGTRIVLAAGTTAVAEGQVLRQV